MENNENLRNMLVHNIEETEGDNVLSVQSAVLESNSLLKCLYECAEKNKKSSKYKHRNRFDEELKIIYLLLEVDCYMKLYMQIWIEFYHQ